MNLAAGTRVSSTVCLVRPLGRGGMGSVWVADHLTLRTEVVVKFMAEALAADPVSLARFSREASAAAAVKSPHVVQMLDHGFTEDGTPFIVMELLDGEDLKQRLRRAPVMPLAELAAIVTQTCRALARAHAAGIVHRDIKPENLFLCRTDDGEPFVKLLDFGVARSGGPDDFHMTQTGVIVGTPYYMSPEQALGAPPVDASTDLWSLGVVAFEAMTGARPFDGPTMGALTIAICGERPPVPSQLQPAIPPSVDEWVARACARDRERRFPGAKVMADALSEALRSPASPRVVPLAFEATAASDAPPPKPPLSPATAPSRGAKDAALGLATTTGAVTRRSDDEAPTPVATAGTPAAVTGRAAGRHAPTRAAGGSPRWLPLAVGAALLAVGVAAGLALGPPRGAARSPEPARSTGPTSAGDAPRGEPTAEPPPVAPPARAPANAPSPSGDAAPVTARPPPGAGAALALPSTSPPGGTSASGSAARPGRPAAMPGTPRSTAAPSPPPRPSASTAASCEPPYFFDADHNKVFKPECL